MEATPTNHAHKMAATAGMPTAVQQGDDTLCLLLDLCDQDILAHIVRQLTCAKQLAHLSLVCTRFVTKVIAAPASGNTLAGPGQSPRSGGPAMLSIVEDAARRLLSQRNQLLWGWFPVGLFQGPVVALAGLETCGDRGQQLLLPLLNFGERVDRRKRLRQ